jgi:DNA-binding XRE family transcriptional regulator
MAGIPSIVAKWWLGTHSQKLREAAVMTRDEASKSLPISAAVLASIEYGRTLPSDDTAAEMLKLYGATEEYVENYFDYLTAARQRTRTHVHADAVTGFDTFLGLEAGASVLKVFSPRSFHGLLPTFEFTDNFLKPTNPDDLTRRQKVNVRQNRKKNVLYAPSNLQHLHVIMGEEAILNDIGGTDVMFDQLVELERLIDQEAPLVTFQILPINCGPNPGTRGPFTIMQFPLYGDPKCVYRETRTSGVIYNAPTEIALHELDWEQLISIAWTPEQSKLYLRNRRKVLK